MIVTCNPYFNCTHCYSCRRGLVNCCTTNQTMGCQRDRRFFRVRGLPLSASTTAEGVPPKTLALIEPFCISYHGVSRANIKPETGCWSWERAPSACWPRWRLSPGARVYVADVAGKKLQFAMDSFGLEGTLLNDSPEHFLEQGGGGHGRGRIRRDHRGGGPASTFQNCIDAAAFGGNVVLIGIGKKNLDFNFTTIQKRN